MGDPPAVVDAEALRNHLAAIVASSDDAIISKTLDGVIISWNAGAERIFGYNAEEVIGKPITILIPPDHMHEEPEILRRLRAGDRTDHYETVRVRKDGTIIHVSLSISPIRDATGQIVAASKIARDISEQKRTATALQASDARFRIMGDSAPVMIWLADTSKGRTWFNRSWYDFTGRTSEQEIGFGWAQHVHADDLRACLKLYSESFDARVPFRMEFRLASRAGAWRWVVENGTPLYEGVNGRFSGYIGCSTDVSEFRKAQFEREALLGAERAARAEAERLSRVKDEFLATLSHELRTPLNAILGWSALLRRLEPGSSDHLRGLETIERNARSQSQIIADLLDMSRIISGKVHLDVQPVDLNELVRAAVEVVRPSMRAKNLRLRMTLSENICRLRGDPGRLQQVLWNLLTNAVKFTPPDGCIDVGLARTSSHIEISVDDTGIGIKSEFLPYVFDRFRQADSSTTRRHGGLGLGLSIVRHLVELHGGSVRVNSAGEGRGASFVVSLPTRMTFEEDSGLFPRPGFADVEVATLELPRLDGITALIVDDEADARMLIERLIQERGARAVLAENASEALAWLSAERVDIMISDIGMPDVDGYQLIRRVRENVDSNVKSVMAVALTAYARPEDRQRALLAGYQMHLSKPVDPRELVAGVASLLHRAGQ